MMAKRIVSSVPNHKVKVMKRGIRKTKKKSLLRRFIDYLKLDTHMFAPLISSKSSLDLFPLSSSSPGVDASEPILGDNKNLMGKVKDYLISDQYLYAPLVAHHQPLFHASIRTPSPKSKGLTLGLRKSGTTQEEAMKKLADETRKRETIRTRELCFRGRPYGETAVIGHAQLTKETAKQLVQQNCHA